jgi:hypothetical protein
MGMSGNGLLLDLLSGLSWFNVVCWKDAPRDMFSIHNAWNSICPSQIKVEWWKLVWHKYVILQFSFILWLATLLTQDKLMFMVLFRLTNAFFVWVVEKILISYFLVALSLIIFGMIYALKFLSPLEVDHHLCSKILISFRSGSPVSSSGYLSRVEVTLFN